MKGYPSHGDNRFPLINRIISELFSVICDHTKGKPILVFAATRNLCLKAAGSLVKAYQAAKDTGRRLPWSNHSRSKLSCDNKQLEECSAYGIAFHHGGLSLEDRRKIETAFRSGKINVIVATSTLAVGVNLPAHTVILAGTYQWSGSGMIDLSDLDVQQMIGRAGRPQYDTEGTAIILCSESNQAKYRDLVNSCTTIESCLHEHLIEHINTEIGLKTITCLQEGQDWIKSSFLYVRIQQNPRHYSGILASAGSSSYDWEEALTRLVRKAVEDLQGRDMVQMQEPESTPEPEELRRITATVYGEAMSSNCLSFATMCNILDLPAKSSLEDLLHALSNAHEYADLKLRNGEKLFYKSLAKDSDMRFSLPNGISPSTAAHKVFIIIQMTLGNVDWEPYKEQLKQGASGPALDSYQVFRVAPRICKAMATIALQKEDGETLKNALALIRVVSGKAWPGTAVIFRQIDAIGAKSIKVLGSKGITSFQRLARTDPRQIEMLLNRQTGFGNKIVTAAKTFPVFHVTINQETKVPETATGPVDILFRVDIEVDGKLTESSKKKATNSRSISVLATLTDGTYVAYRKASAKTLREEDLTMTLPARFQYSNQRFQVIVGLDQVSGCDAQACCKPVVPDGILQPPVTNGAAKLEEEQVIAEPPKSPIRNSLVTGSRQDDDQDELMIEAPKEEDVARLPNGNWPCSHSCASKTNCKHVCCKEGTKKKPKTLTNKAQVKQPSFHAEITGTSARRPDAKRSSEMPTLTASQPKKARVRKRLSLTQYEPIDLLSNSDSNSTEDEKEAVNRILKGTQRKGLLPSKKPRVDSGDSNEFDDPSFDTAVKHMDLDLELNALSKDTGRGRHAESRRELVNDAERQRRTKRLPAVPSPSSKAAEKPLKSGRPQPVRRNRQLLNTESLEEIPDQAACVALVRENKELQVPEEENDDVFKNGRRLPLSQRPLFAASDEDMNGSSGGEFDQEFLSNGLLGSEKNKDQVCTITREARSNSVLPEDHVHKFEDELDAYLDDHMDEQDSKTCNSLDTNRAELPDLDAPAVSIPSGMLESTCLNKVPLMSRSQATIPYGTNQKNAGHDLAGEYCPPTFANKIEDQAGASRRYNDIDQGTGIVPLSNPATNQTKAHEDGDYLMADIKEAAEMPEEEDDFLADFDRWVENGGVQFGD